MQARLSTLLTAVALVVLVGASPASAAFPGQNGRIAFEHGTSGFGSEPDTGEIYSINPDGTGVLQLTSNSVFDGAPAWSPDGSKIAFASHRDGGSEIYTMPASGGAATRLTNNSVWDAQPAWSPDGTKIAFTRFTGGVACGGPFAGDVPEIAVYVMNADGTNQTRLTFQGVDDSPAWSPDGTRIAWDSKHWFYDVNEETCIPEPEEIWVVDPDGTDKRLVVTGSQISFIEPLLNPAWSPDGRRIAFDSEAPDGIGLVNPDGSGLTVVNSPIAGEGNPAWSPDGTKIAFDAFSSGHGDLFTMNLDGSGVVNVTNTPVTDEWMPDWQPLPVNTASSHIRPKGASPIYASLVTAFKPCTSGNRTHGPPLAHPSCNPPVPESPNLAISVGETQLRSIGSLRARVLAGAPGGADDTDVQLTFSLTNVLKASDHSEYSGELQVRVPSRVTDKDGAVSSTTQTFALAWAVPCAPTADPQIASACTSNTTLDAVLPGAAAEGTRALWALDAVQVHDGGPDGNAETESNNSLFMKQGVFVP